MYVRTIFLALAWYHPKLHLGIARYARDHGWHLNEDMAYLQQRGQVNVGDGMITQKNSDRLLSSQIQNYLDSLDIPRVMLGKDIFNDNDKIGVMAANFFVRRGYRNLAVCSPGASVRFGRLQVFADEVRSQGRDCHIMEIPEDFDCWESRAEWIAEELKAAPKPMAVFAVDDNYALEIIEAARVAGINVPNQVSVLGVRNDDLICETAPVTLSSIDNNLDGMGYQAAALMDRILDGGEMPEEPIRVPPVQVVERQSTDVMAIEHEGVRKAMQFIREHFREPISLNDIVQSSSMSARGLYKAFDQHAGTPICDHLKEYRIGEARKRMLRTNENMENIAYTCGFGCYRNLYNAFKHNTGMSPAEWRSSNRSDHRV